MSNKYLSVVDYDDNIIGLHSRDEIHGQGLCHRAVHILIFNTQDELFLQKRSMQKDLNKGLWDTSAAGHVDAGEDYFPAALRETEEELGVSIADSIQPLFKLCPTEQTGMEFIQVYRGKHNGPFRLEPGEIDDGRWFGQSLVDLRVKSNDPTLTEIFKVIWQTLRQL